MAVIVGEEQPAAGRAGITCGDLHKSSLQYLMEQKGLNCPYLTPDPLSLRPSDPRQIQYMVDYCKAHESSMRVTSVTENLLPRLFSVL